MITDNFEASREAVRYLIGLGHKRIAIVITAAALGCHGGSAGRLPTGLEGGAPCPSARIIFEAPSNADISPQSGYQCGLELMQLPDPPTAIFCANNRMTLGVMHALGELRIPCPERVSILGFDDFDWAAGPTRG